MKVELVSFYVREDMRSLFTSFTTFNEEFPCLGIYLGQDDEHVWIQPLMVAKSLDEPNYSTHIMSVSRFPLQDVIYGEPRTCNQWGAFGEMIYQGGSAL